jgi:hypothetical protein
MGSFRRARRPIVHIVRLYQLDGANADLCRRRALRRCCSPAACSGSALATRSRSSPPITTT